MDGAFADTYPILPGGQPSQIMTSYLVPYTGARTYTYTAPLNIARMNFVLPGNAHLSLSADGLTGPETSTLQDGKTYMVYSYGSLKAAETLNISIAGIGVEPESGNPTKNNLLAISAAFLGFAVIGAGLWWWRGPEPAPVEVEPTFDDIITEIALLDESYKQRGLSVAEYQEQRQGLLRKAKQLS